MKKFLSIFMALVVFSTFAFFAVGSGGNDVEEPDAFADVESPTFEDNDVPTTENTKMSAAELEAAISQQDVKITSTKYLVQDDNYKALYPDMLQAIIQNDSAYDLKNACVAFVAWDENNLPVKIVSNTDFSGGSYVAQCNYEGINLISGASYGNNSGLALNSDTNNIATFKAIVVSYETFDGESWENPLFQNWREVYEEQRLN